VNYRLNISGIESLGRVVDTPFMLGLVGENAEVLPIKIAEHIVDMIQHSDSAK